MVNDRLRWLRRENYLEKLLKYKNVNINQRNNDGHTVLSYSIIENNKKDVDLFLEHPCIDLKNFYKNQDFYTYVIENGEYTEEELLELPLTHETFTTNKGQTILHLLAIYKNSIEEVNQVLHLLDKKDNNGNTPLHIACKLNKESIIQTIIKYYQSFETNNHGYTAFDFYQGNDMKVSQLFYDNGIDLFYINLYGNCIFKNIKLDDEIMNLANKKFNIQKVTCEDFKIYGNNLFTYFLMYNQKILIDLFCIDDYILHLWYKKLSFNDDPIIKLLKNIKNKDEYRCLYYRMVVYYPYESVKLIKNILKYNNEYTLIEYLKNIQDNGSFSDIDNKILNTILKYKGRYFGNCTKLYLYLLSIVEIRDPSTLVKLININNIKLTKVLIEKYYQKFHNEYKYKNVNVSIASFLLLRKPYQFKKIYKLIDWNRIKKLDIFISLIHDYRLKHVHTNIELIKFKIQMYNFGCSKFLSRHYTWKNQKEILQAYPKDEIDGYKISWLKKFNKLK